MNGTALQEGRQLRRKATGSHLLSNAAAPSTRVQRPTTGSWARVETESGTVSWSGHISYVNGEILGLRGAMPAEELFTSRDAITVHIGRGDAVVSSQARVLIASGRLLRILVRRSIGNIEQRGATRVRVRHPVSVSRRPSDQRGTVDAEIIDLSCVGCALRSEASIRTSERLSLRVDLDGVELDIVGDVVRTWRDQASGPIYAGIHFDAVSLRTAHLIRRFLVGQLRAHQSRGA